MSLIVARKDQSKIYIVSDTKLTAPTGQTFNKGQQVSAGETVIKTTIINPLSCISFAGNVAFAETALKIISPCDSMKEVTDKLLASHLLADHFTDYIYAVIEEGNPYIFEIKNGRCQSTESTWVGSQPAFSRFQSYMLGEHKKESEAEFSKCN